ncbi:TIGR00156 family protein [Chimaeribacter arupi]|uniref:TIGR00156 family protein n=2 Tax=Enterobacterales TaxID=91347 RepID=A0A2N5EHN8_9GAMM|nr:TIGR00156 family protein [Chimaeribacter arupi]PLR42203.1 TIGR00156 family protein [Chimaeribacter arupi]PLR42984.1 TIGR00156 family protein [Chimaeribacter arupi]PLR43719.1 TIGR00156 family protein [Chimaeribacter arupi]
MMKKMTLAALIALFTLPAVAQQGGFIAPNAPAQASQGGFTGPAASPATVKAVQEMKDDAWVRLEGHIEQRTGDEHYLFRDNTGTLTVEIDDKRWAGQNVSPTDKVQLEGEVDKEWSNVQVDVKSVKKVL